MHDGFDDTPDLGVDLPNLLFDEVSFDPTDTTYFLGRERVEDGGTPGMATWGAASSPCATQRQRPVDPLRPAIGSQHRHRQPRAHLNRVFVGRRLA